MRPVLKSALRRLWRDRSTLQIGLDPDRALVLAGCDDETMRVLDALDGTHERMPGGTAGPESPDQRLVELLMNAGVLDDAGASTAPVPGLDRDHRDRLAPDLASLSVLTGTPDAGLGPLRRRRDAAVRVHGAGRVGTALALLLAGAGVGAIDVEDPAPTRPADCAPGGLSLTDVGRRRDAATHDLLAQFPVRCEWAGPRPSAAVLVGPASADLRLRAELLRAGVPHLAAAVRETTGLVGTFVLPGRSACLRCVDLYRADRDPAWPMLAAQLANGRATVEACDTVLAAAVAACAAREVLTLLDGVATPATVSGTVELALPSWRWRRRTWPPHPDCQCLGE